MIEGQKSDKRPERFQRLCLVFSCKIQRNITSLCPILTLILVINGIYVAVSPVTGHFNGHLTHQLPKVERAISGSLARQQVGYPECTRSVPLTARLTTALQNDGSNGVTALAQPTTTARDSHCPIILRQTITKHHAHFLSQLY
jgi:hypothetical protein